MNTKLSAGQPALRVGLLWHSLASGNLGVDALTVADLAILEEELTARGVVGKFTIIGMRDNFDKTKAYGHRVLVIDRKSIASPGGYWRELASLDCIVDIGGGDSFTEIYGPKRFFYLWLTKALAIARGVPLLFAPQTIGPFTKPLYRRLAGLVMSRAVAVIARDEKSLVAIGEVAPGARRALAVDVAFRLPFVDRSNERGGSVLRIGVNASGLLFHQAETGKNRFGLSYDYAAMMRALLRELIARSGVEVHLIVHATSATDPADDDGALADRLAVEFPSAIRVPDFSGASEAKTYISSLDFLAAARMHACIGAFSAGTPVVPIAYSRKFGGLFGLLGYDHVLPVASVDEDGARRFIVDRIDRREELAAGIARGMTRITKLLSIYRAEVQRLFDQAIARRP